MINEILKKPKPEEAIHILKMLAKSDEKLKQRIIELADKSFKDIVSEARFEKVGGTLWQAVIPLHQYRH